MLLIFVIPKLFIFRKVEPIVQIDNLVDLTNIKSKKIPVKATKKLLPLSNFPNSPKKF